MITIQRIAKAENTQLGSRIFSKVMVTMSIMMELTMKVRIIMKVFTFDGFIEACSEVKACEPRMPHHILCAASLIAYRDKYGYRSRGRDRELVPEWKRRGQRE